MSKENTFSRWLREHEVTQTMVWRALGVQPSVVSKWASGKMRPGLTHALAIEHLSGGWVPACSWLVEGEKLTCEPITPSDEPGVYC